MSGLNASDDAPAGSSAGWWREAYLLIALLIVAGIYLPRLTALPLRGEEPRRVLVAAEALRTGDWVVPRLQGQVYVSRPPLGSWPIALVGWATGELDRFAARFPTALATLALVALIYGYGRTFLTPLGALTACLAYATMGQVLQLARVAETEATFTLLVASSLFVWHWGYQRRWPAWLPFVLGGGLAALAGLAKGPQGPVYFFGPVLAYLAWKRDWRTLFSGGHAAGWASFAAIVGAWQVPFLAATDAEAAKAIWGHNAAARFTDYAPWRLVRHLVSYPVEILICTLPWSPFLLRYADRRFRQAISDVKPQLVFLFICLAVTFPTVWLAPDARGRYFMPLYPCLAVLIGLVVERCAVASGLEAWRRTWSHGVRALAGVAVVGAAAVATATWSGLAALRLVSQPSAFAALYVAACSIMAVALWRLARPTTSRRAAAAIVVAVSFIGLTYSGVVLNGYLQSALDHGPEVQRLKALKAGLPEQPRLASIGWAPFSFSYHYRDPIRYFADAAEAAQAEDWEWFVFEQGQLPAELPFDWEVVDQISLDRARRPQPHRLAIVARRLPAASTAAAAGGLERR